MITKYHHRASKLKDHKIGRSPYLLETQYKDFLRELVKFKAEKQSSTAAIMYYINKSCRINRTSVIHIDRPTMQEVLA